MKKSKNIVLIVTPVLSAALFNACGSSRQPSAVVNTTTPTTNTAAPNPISTVPAQTAQTRDVYNNLNDCVKDWVDKELCEQMSENDDRDYRTRYRTTGTGRYFYGPRYSSSSSDRIIVYKGKTITPTGKVTTKMPTFVSSVPTAKTSTSTTSSTSSTTKSSTLPSSTSTTKSTTSTSTYPSSSSSSSSSTNPYSSSSSSTSPYSSSSSTTRGGFGSTSSSSSSRSSSFSSGS